MSTGLLGTSVIIDWDAPDVATAHANGLPLSIRNPNDVGGLGEPIEVVAI